MGVLKNISFAEYQAIPAINISTLKLLKQSPEHFKLKERFPSPPSNSQVLGSAIHAALLQPEIFMEKYAPMPKFGRKKEDLALKADYIGQNSTKTFLVDKDYKQIEYMRTAANKEECWQTLISKAVAKEVVITFDLKGVKCKAQIDLVSKSEGRYALSDIKTTSRFWSFKSDIKKFGYMHQLAFYKLALASVKVNIDTSYLIAFEKKMPYKMGFHKITNELLEPYVQEIMFLLQEYKDREEKNNWTSNLIYEYSEGEL